MAPFPPGSTINSVTLQLRMSKTTAETEPVRIHGLLADWGEGTSNASGGQGTNASTGDATWIHRMFDNATWSTEGGDFSSDPSATTEVANIGSYTWGSTSEMVADVQFWVDSPAMNFGWIVIGNESIPHTTKRFDSRETSGAANRPLLTITFTPP